MSRILVINHFELFGLTQVYKYGDTYKQIQGSRARPGAAAESQVTVVCRSACNRR